MNMIDYTLNYLLLCVYTPMSIPVSKYTCTRKSLFLNFVINRGPSMEKTLQHLLLDYSLEIQSFRFVLLNN
jgi:hypothetical protein